VLKKERRHCSGVATPLQSQSPAVPVAVAITIPIAINNKLHILTIIHGLWR
jgi:hypothetical protein